MTLAGHPKNRDLADELEDPSLIRHVSVVGDLSDSSARTRASRR